MYNIDMLTECLGSSVKMAFISCSTDGLLVIPFKLAVNVKASLHDKALSYKTLLDIVIHVLDGMQKQLLDCSEPSIRKLDHHKAILTMFKKAFDLFATHLYGDF